MGKTLLRILEFSADPAENSLLRDGKRFLTPKAFHLLNILVENHGHIVDKDKLITEIWSDSFVEEGNLAVNAAMLRKALADDAGDPTFIETIPRRGYRFIADVKEETDDRKPTNGLTEANGTRASGSPASSSYLSVAAVVGYIIGVVGIAVWYARDGLLGAESVASILSTPFSSNKFSTSGTVAHAIISKDGKYAGFTDESAGMQSLWLRQIESGENPDRSPSDDFYFGLTFSNSGNLIFCP